MKKLISTILISSLFLTSAIGTYAAVPTNLPAISTTFQHPSQKTEFLFVMQANQAVITQTSEGFKLTLTDVNGKILYFSDRPARKAGSFSTDLFMSHWIKPDSGFQKDPPNAAMVFDEMPIDKDNITRAKVIKLDHPTSNGHHSWSFKITPLNNQLTPGTYNKVSIFIDLYNNGIYWANGQWNGTLRER